MTDPVNTAGAATVTARLSDHLRRPAATVAAATAVLTGAMLPT